MLSLRRSVPAVLVLGLWACGGDDSSPPPPDPVDQSFEPGAADALVGIGAVGAYAQTFTVGVTGSLTAVDLLLASQGTGDVIRVDVRTTNGGIPNLDDANVLGSRLVDASTIPAFPNDELVTIDLDQDIPCTAGQVLAIVVIRETGAGSSDVLWISENTAGENYVGGTQLQRNAGSGTAWLGLTNDFYFRTRVRAAT